MATLEQVHYEKDDGKLVAVEVYNDGSKRIVRIKNGITQYILLGADK